MDDRSRLLLKTLIERYIADGQPVGSRTLSRFSHLELSPATIRNVMSDLEEEGLIASPHTSAGRIPTPLGYRLFVDSLITVQPLQGEQARHLRGALVADEPKRVISKAASLLSKLSSFAGVVLAPRRASTFRQIEFLRLSERRVLLIIVSAEGDVQNRILSVERDLPPAALVEAANFINSHYAGVDFEEIKTRVRTELVRLQQDISTLMQRALEAGSEAAQDQSDSVVVAGERNFVGLPDFSANMSRLKELFGLFEKKTELMQLLEGSSRADGIRIWIGGESRVVPFEELSVVAAPYEIDGQVVGTLGVIGPTRMAYNRMIQIVDITSRLVGNALSTK